MRYVERALATDNTRTHHTHRIHGQLTHVVGETKTLGCGQPASLRLSGNTLMTGGTIRFRIYLT